MLTRQVVLPAAMAAPNRSLPTLTFAPNGIVSITVPFMAPHGPLLFHAPVIPTGPGACRLAPVLPANAPCTSALAPIGPAHVSSGTLYDLLSRLEDARIE